MPFESTKSFYNYPCAHRQHRADTHCKFIHGYSRSFHFLFGVQNLDKCGWAVDFGDLDWIKDYLSYMFDHTLLLNMDDPMFDTFRELEKQGVCALRTMATGVGMEGTAQHLCQWADEELRKRTKGRCWVVQVEVCENEKNSAIYHNPNAGFQGWG